MTQTSQATVPVSGETYGQILDFYAGHMQALDEGSVELWASGFTEDGVFAQNVKPEPWRGRSAIEENMRRGLARLAQKNVQRRHWFGMVTTDQRDQDTVRTRYYAVVFETPVGGKASVYLSTTGEDLLVRQDGQWRVKHRLITHDAT
ncbi:nuclear transport factor 2 family protein [Streptantibioticus rubrisoli]|uniref:Nuclear transport factor 2 family protein n=1 Tax=Streptantibioticus rubrisoli TaxID=1387313 RepID=A0ABT1PGN6_9ACTN|nr:nuclear transport factor 2 family protein [Streptantibioticus rubrisoli]MCQ4044527.1 nuclear transport factor 2 family protein [Streptantibioticus rubrisoli]